MANTRVKLAPTNTNSRRLGIICSTDVSPTFPQLSPIFETRPRCGQNSITKFRQITLKFRFGVVICCADSRELIKLRRLQTHQSIDRSQFSRRNSNFNYRAYMPNSHLRQLAYKQYRLCNFFGNKYTFQRRDECVCLVTQRMKPRASFAATMVSAIILPSRSALDGTHLESPLGHRLS